MLDASSATSEKGRDDKNGGPKPAVSLLAENPSGYWNV
jgi:hypothetical protein